MFSDSGEPTTSDDPEERGAEQPSPESLAFLSPPQEPDELGRLGTYRVLRVLGSGGMGIVFEAEDLQLHRSVALKTMKAELAASPTARQRFLQEARAAAAVEHDHIVAVYQVGEDRGIPFLAMQLLQGESLDRRLRREKRLPVDEVLRIGRQIAAGLAAAHARELIHRDIKPANVWLETLAGEEDGSAVRDRVKILDFGVARLAAGNSKLTHPGVPVGTPQYMAPEQASGESVDARCDLFSLGCVFYVMCTGTAPFKGANITGLLWALALHDPKPPRELNPEVPPALSDLVLRLLAKNPWDRPESARHVVEELLALEESWQTRGFAPAVDAPPQVASTLRPEDLPTPRKKLSSRRRILGIATGVLGGALIVAGVLFGPAVYRFLTDQGQLVIISDDPHVEVVVRQGEEQITTLDGQTDRAVSLKAGTYQLELAEDKGHLTLETKEFSLTRNGHVVVHVRFVPAIAEDAELKALLLRETDPQADREQLRLDTLAFLKQHVGTSQGQRAAKLLWRLPSPLDRLDPEQIAPHKRRAAELDGTGQTPAGLVAILGDGQLRHWNWVMSVSFSPDGKAVAAGGPDRVVRLWDVATGTDMRQFRGHTEQVHVVTFSRDGRTLVSVGQDRTIRVWDVAGSRERIPAFKHTSLINAAAITPDGQTVAWGGTDRTISLWNLATGRQSLLGEHTDRITVLAFSPDGQTLVSGSGNGTMKVWDMATGKSQALKGHTSWVYSLAFAADSRLLVSSSYDRTVKLWDVATGEERAAFGKLPREVWAAAITPNGLTVVCGSDDQALTFWDVATRTVRSRKDLTGHPRSLAISPDGSRLVMACGDVQLWDMASMTRLPTGFHFGSLAFAGTGHLLACGSDEGTMHRFETATGKELPPLAGLGGRVGSVAFTATGVLVGGIAPNTIYSWDMDTGKARTIRTQHLQGLHALAISPDGRLAASCGRGEAAVILWDLATGAQRGVLAGHEHHVLSLAFRPDGRTLASGSDDHTVKLWDTAQMIPLGSLLGHRGPVRSVAFRMDGKMLASASQDQTVTIWDPATGKARHTLHGHTQPVQSVVFRGDGEELASAGEDGWVWLWDPETGAQKRGIQIGPIVGRLGQIAYSPEGRYLATINGNGTVYLLRLAR